MIIKLLKFLPLTDRRYCTVTLKSTHLGFIIRFLHWIGKVYLCSKKAKKRAYFVIIDKTNRLINQSLNQLNQISPLTFLKTWYNFSSHGTKEPSELFSSLGVCRRLLLITKSSPLKLLGQIQRWAQCLRIEQEMKCSFWLIFLKLKHWEQIWHV